MNWSPLPPAVAAVVAAAISLIHRNTTILVQSSIDIPNAETLALYTIGGRALAFVLVYGLLLGVAYWVGRHSDDEFGLGTTALATGAVGGVVYLVGTAAILLWVDFDQEVVGALAALGSAIGVGVELAVVAFAGLALGRSLISR